MDEFKDKTNEELIFELQKNESNDWIYGRDCRYVYLDQASKSNPINWRYDHKRENIKEQYNSNNYPKDDKSELEVNKEIQHEVEKFLIQEHNRSQDDLEKNRWYISISEWQIIYAQPIGEWKYTPYLYHRNGDNRELDKEAIFE